MRKFFLEKGQLLGSETLDRVELCRILSEYSTLSESSDVLLAANLMFQCVFLAHVFQPGMADTGKRICQLGVCTQPFALRSAYGGLPNWMVAGMIEFIVFVLHLGF